MVADASFASLFYMWGGEHIFLYVSEMLNELSFFKFMSLSSVQADYHILWPTAF